MGRTTTDADRGRLYAREGLIKSGLKEEEADHWCAAWEAESERQRLRADSQYFWDAGRGWIDAQRASPVRPGPSRPNPGRHPETRPAAFSVTRS
jgi:hypothetical protein